MAVRIITDSGCDIVGADNPQLDVLPLSITFGSTVYADGVDLCHVFGNGTECGHGAEGDTLEIHVETCNYDALACVGQIDAYAHQFVIEKLRLVNANNFGVFGQLNDSCRCAYWGGVDGIGIVRYHILVAITRVDGWFVYFYFLLGYFCAAQAADEFFGFAREHGTADYFNAAVVVIFFLKKLHGVKNRRPSDGKPPFGLHGLNRLFLSVDIFLQALEVIVEVGDKPVAIFKA